ncbi:Hypothetical Protein FCC1311_048332 [Hondaea fermentalgiana]|uniref:Uncharacterized protein n=1 Tax=Hondaea fermentalgiana TaxID=2315210 RepID=A0A2R5GC97_9STRA|nr:Hypothetical Protein FCC1311_048332 [Hondaea fermentalgiana]|eukprot:GBG28612.1 Hypothetical Protein FCC1311_048332 [Hondaea fermentalgiana]
MKAVVNAGIAFLGTHVQMMSLLLPWITVKHGVYSSSQETLYDVGRILRDMHTIWVGIDTAGITTVEELLASGFNIDPAQLGFAGAQDVEALLQAALQEPPVRAYETTLAMLVIATTLSILGFLARLHHMNKHAETLRVIVAMGCAQTLANVIAISVFLGATAMYTASTDIHANAAGIFFTVLAIIASGSILAVDGQRLYQGKQEPTQEETRLVTSSYRF